MNWRTDNLWSLVGRYFLIALGASCALSAKAVEHEVGLNPIIHDPSKILGPDSCTKCHEKEMQSWHGTPHFSTFDSLHRKPEARAIADRLGLASIKRNDTCVACHYTEQQVGERVRVVAGVSCESCHGAAQDWIALHNDYGGPNITKESETPEHRQQRIETSVQAGMNNPANLYLIARQCLACHTTPDEALVNVGGHAAGSKDFELVSWSQGMVRHNFLRTGSALNAESTPEQLRVMYVVGILADLEASLRATAAATSKSPFGIAAAQRAAGLKHKLYEIDQLVTDTYINDALDAALGVPLKLNHSAELNAAADTIGKSAYDFAAEADGSKLAAIDPLLPTPNHFKNQ
ncbi:cytochrome c family protein [Bythopirellula goksoeyrii]|uniref:Perchlorate reductase subunit gamma n=1 Tax=Bythopirellula goksoeyrii TaxID=1400387 RepID=A0A5B9Q6P1_9BACT|nr:cytochrome c family protein [Bythopirellula goksoeyrii]QEG33092.1 Perchlorate reductase subunit gamma precursor [Bythopirellula goksoeyrii]